MAGMVSLYGQYVVNGVLLGLFLPSRAAVPNLWVATPRGVAINFHWGRHWSSDIAKNPCTIIARPQCSLLSLSNIVLCQI